VSEHRSKAAVTAVHVAVRDALADLGPGDVVLVACSGGPDSLALAAATAALARRYGWRAGAVVVDHGWSVASAGAGRQAVATCREFGLEPVELIAVDSSGPGGPEAAARTARYRALAQAAESHRASAVLLGHTLDDQAETVLLGLARGSGARSLAGMPAERGVYRRPLLGLTRAVTVEACAGLGLQPWLDPANDDPAYARVRLRGLAGELERILGPGIAQALARSADLLRDDADALDAAAAQLLTAADPDGRGELDVRVLTAAPRAVRRRALLAAARQAGSPGGDLGHRHAAALEALLTGRTGAGADLPGAVIARLTRQPGRSGDVTERNRLLIFATGRSERRDMGNLRPSPEPADRPQQR
jgi:tRNA(Ile)-lysidine synthase